MSKGLGVMVQGPHGVGKSHSLVNVVRKLESTGDYLVTFIPNCGTWDDIGELYDFVCESFGSTSMALIREIGDTVPEEKIYFKAFTKAVDKILKAKGKTWVFVFDQVNELLPPFPEKADLSRLVFPYNQTCNLIRKCYRTCVISASANNETVLSDKMGAFMNYNCIHPMRMQEPELRLAFIELKGKSETGLKNLIALTDGVPWQVYLRLHEEALDKHNVLTPEQLDKRYRNNEVDRIRYSLMVLNTTVHALIWKDMVKAAISCFLELAVLDSIYFDRKYSYLTDPTEGGKFPERAIEGKMYAPVHPIVLAAYQRYFWDDLMAYLHHEESNLLTACRRQTTSHCRNERIFQLLVIQRCREGDIAISNTSMQLPQKCPYAGQFDGDALPRVMVHEGMYVRVEGTFCAIDMLWKSGNSVWGVQIHVNEHKDELTKFNEMCEAAGWKDKDKNYALYLVYLSPEEDVAHLVRKRVPEQPKVGMPMVQVLCCKDIKCLADIKWEAGCSLSKPQTTNPFEKGTKAATSESCVRSESFAGNECVMPTLGRNKTPSPAAKQAEESFRREKNWRKTCL